MWPILLLWIWYIFKYKIILGDCDFETGVCKTCDPDYTGTNCKAKKLASTFVHPVVNCKQGNTIFLGYNNRLEEARPSADIFNEFICDNDIIEVGIGDSILPGQHNFIAKVECKKSILWNLGGIQITMGLQELNQLGCAKTQQSIVFKDTSTVDLVKLAQEVETPESDVSSTPITNTNDVLVTIKARNSSTIPNVLTKIQTRELTLTQLAGVQDDTNINVLTFNETVGNQISLRGNPLTAQDPIVEEPISTISVVAIVIAIIAAVLILALVVIGLIYKFVLK